ncbi:polyprenyl synthetase family protein [Streptosporangium sp. 'caverna']|uniref:polyprenyl synthetase family protein n=1 Tax=Streptosporangium sp. 'caverna' TaxID=2202249 RepID=UPI0019550DE5|nr:polyprenyl synthetase family protein [Streptosporangium sp. 'caverna']
MPTSALSVERTLIDARKAVVPALKTAVNGLSAPMRRLAEYHFGWSDQQGAHVVDTGKGTRPILTLLACEAVGGEFGQAVPAAVAIELVHNASLLHDDVLDRDRLRRHRPAIWAVAGVPEAILLGDALLFLGVRTLAEAPDPLGSTGVKWLVTAAQQLVEGEHADLMLEERDDFSLAEVTAMAHAKSGVLIAEACALGALAGGADADRIDHLRAYGAHLGQAGQLTDDLLGIWGDPAVTGKPRLADLQARKKSLPVAAALTADNTAARELADLYREPSDPDQLQRIADLVEAAGGRAWADEEARRHARTALEHLRAAAPTPRAAQALTLLANQVADRTR